MAEDTPLVLSSTIGFGGSIPNGLNRLPGSESIVYPLGSTVVIESVAGKHTQRFLQGHNGTVTCVAVSRSGKYIASGQETYAGYKADIILWDAITLTEVRRMTLHKASVRTLAFSPSDKYIASLGGVDDGTVCIWDLATGIPLCDSITGMRTSGAAEAIVFLNKSDTTFMTGGSNTLRVWTLDTSINKLAVGDVNMGALRRVVKTMVPSLNDEFMYCGTSTGDVLQVNVKTKILRSQGPTKGLFGNGVTCMTMLPNNDLIIGTGDGTVAYLQPSTFAVKRKATLEGSITSVSLAGKGEYFFAGTDHASIYKVGVDTFTTEQRSICHFGGVRDVVFPRGTSDIFATCAANDIRVWHVATNKQLLRINVPNKVCNALAFSPDGSTIISGWDDGVVRAFYPESGRLKYELLNAHNRGVTAVASTHDGKCILSGGGDGQVRVWNTAGSSQTLANTMKEHKGRITSINVSKSNLECVTSSLDGTCIIWSLKTFSRQQIVFANSQFQQVQYRPDEAQIVSVGTDRQLAYWEVYNGKLIREIEVTATGAVNSVSISTDGNNVALGGDDKVLKLLTYKEGKRIRVGLGHSGNIVRCQICPNQKYIISVSADGAIFTWLYPTGV